MKRTNWLLLGFVVLLALALTLPTGCGKKKTEEQAKPEPMEESSSMVTPTELPAPVIATMEANSPGAEIGMVETEKKDGITLYDIEFKNDLGEIEVADDGTIMNVVTIVTMADLPEAAAAAIQGAAEGMTIGRLERSEIHSEINTEGEQTVIAKLDTLRYEYEAELARNDSTAEVTVDADGNIVEPLKWETE